MAESGDISIDKLSIEIEAKAKDNLSALTALASSLKTIRSAVAGGMEGLETLSRNLDAFTQAIKGIDIDRIVQFAAALSVLKKNVGKGIEGITLPKINTSGSLSQAKEELDKAEEDIKAQIARIKQTIKSGGKKDGNIFSSFSKEIGKLKEKAGSATPVISKFFSTFGRIAVYRFIRTALREIVKAFSEGTKAVYEFDKASGGNIAKNFDALKVSLNEMKGNLGAFGAQLLSNVTPALTALAELVSDIGVELSKTFAVWAGETKYIRAVKKDTDALTKSAEKAKASLFGFDEINKFSSNGSEEGYDFKEIELTEKEIEKAKANIELIKGLVTVAGILAIADAILSIVPAIHAVYTACTFLMSHPIVAAVAAIIAIIISAMLWGDKIAEKIQWLSEKIQFGISWVQDLVGGFFDNIIAKVSEKFPVVGEFLKGVKNFVLSTFEIIKSWIDFFLTKIKTFFSVIYKLVHGDFKGALEDMKGFLKSIANFFITVANKILGMFSSIINIAIEGINKLIGVANLIPGVNIPIIPKVRWEIPKFAKGGFPEDGLFFANHGELVGNFSNGKTAVANNDQIIEGIKRGVYEAMMEAGGRGDGDITIQIVNNNRVTASEVITSAQRKNRRDGKIVIPVGV